MESETKQIHKDILKMQKDIELIKEILLDEAGERELTDWAKNELEEARKTPKEEYISHEEVKKRILAK